MLTFLLTVALAGLLVGIATNQVTRILRLGSVFELLRMELGFHAALGNRVARFFNEVFECHLCLATEVAVVWVSAGVVADVFDGYDTSLSAWVFGPMLTVCVAAGVDQMIETVREALER